MSERRLRNIFLAGTLFFLLILIGMTIDSLGQVISTRTPPLTEAVVAGKQIWQSKNCNDCHTILGIGGYFAPELTTVVNRRDPAWLATFVADPQVAKPGSTMPNQALTASQANQMVAFFQWVSQVDTNEWPPQPQLALGGGIAPQDSAGQTDLVREGEGLFAQKGCNACHMINGQGAPGPGPDLSHIGSQPYDDLPNTPEFLDQWLQNPQAAKPDTTMPRIEMTEAEREALVAYLVSLQ